MLYLFMQAYKSDEWAWRAFQLNLSAPHVLSLRCFLMYICFAIDGHGFLQVTFFSTTFQACHVAHFLNKIKTFEHIWFNVSGQPHKMSRVVSSHHNVPYSIQAFYSQELHAQSGQTQRAASSRQVLKTISSLLLLGYGGPGRTGQ